MSEYASYVAEFLRDTPADEWDTIWWEGVVPYLPYRSVVAACELYVALANAYDDIEEKEGGICRDSISIDANNNNACANASALAKIHEILNRPQVTQR